MNRCNLIEANEESAIPYMVPRDSEGVPMLDCFALSQDCTQND